jgi:hypothetical protein
MAHREFVELCKEESGLRVYKTILLSPEEVVSDTGIPMFYLRGARDGGLTEAGYRFDHTPRKGFKGRWGRFKKGSLNLVDMSDGAVLVEQKFISWDGGGPPGVLASSRSLVCPEITTGNTEDVLRAAFRVN